MEVDSVCGIKLMEGDGDGDGANVRLLIRVDEGADPGESVTEIK